MNVDPANLCSDAFGPGQILNANALLEDGATVVAIANGGRSHALQDSICFKYPLQAKIDSVPKSNSVKPRNTWWPLLPKFPTPCVSKQHLLAKDSNFNLQVHLSATASAEQCERVLPMSTRRRPRRPPRTEHANLLPYVLLDSSQLMKQRPIATVCVANSLSVH